MKIKMKRSHSYELDASSSRNLPKGGTFEVPDDVAKAAIKEGAAVKVTASKKTSPKKNEGSGSKQPDNDGTQPPETGGSGSDGANS